MSMVALHCVTRLRPTVRVAVDQTRCYPAATSLQLPHPLQRVIVGTPLRFLVGDHLRLRARASRRHDHSPDAAPGSLRLLHCYAQFATNQGGTERQARMVCGALAARGHQVSVLTRKTSGAGQVVVGVTVHARIWTLDGIRLFGTTYLGTAIYHLVRLGRKADALHAHQLYLDAIAALLAGRILRLPVVAKMVGAGAGGDLDRLRSVAGGSVLLRLLHSLDAVIAPSRSCRQELLSVGFSAQRIHVIANGVDLSRFRPDPAQEPSTRMSFGEGPAVVFTGRLIEAKGVPELLEAWPLLLREVPDAHLVIVGSGPLQEELRRRAARSLLADQVHLVSEVSDVRPHLRAAAAFVLPSWAEGLSNALLEAMATGLPSVATAVGAVAEVLDGGATGLLVRPGEPPALASALAALLQGECSHPIQNGGSGAHRGPLHVGRDAQALRGAR